MNKAILTVLNLCGRISVSFIFSVFPRVFSPGYILLVQSGKPKDKTRDFKWIKESINTQYI